MATLPLYYQVAASALALNSRWALEPEENSAAIKKENEAKLKSEPKGRQKLRSSERKKLEMPSAVKFQVLGIVSDFSDKSWFLHSCMYGHAKNLKKIIAHHADLDLNQKTSIDGITALQLASKYGHVEVVRILFSTEVVHYDRDTSGPTALEFASNVPVASALPIGLPKKIVRRWNQNRVVVDLPPVPDVSC